MSELQGELRPRLDRSRPSSLFNSFMASVAYCVTINGPEDTVWDLSLWEQFVLTAGADYCCVQLEVAPTTLRRHCQGYIHFPKSGRRLPAVQRMFLAVLGVHGAHFEAAKGSPKQNREYCSKPDSAVPGSFVEYGVLPIQGARNDLVVLADMARDGASMLSIADAQPGNFLRYHRGLQELQRLATSAPRNPENTVEVLWLFGPTGTGKSRWAFENYPDAYVKMNNKWWDGYLNEDTVIIDDYRPNLCTFQELLRILDRYPMRVEMKGGSTELSATRFVITSSQRPEVLWGGRTEEALGQLLRRISSVTSFSQDGTMTCLKSPTVPYIPEPLFTAPVEVAVGTYPQNVHNNNGVMQRMLGPRVQRFDGERWV